MMGYVIAFIIGAYCGIATIYLMYLCAYYHDDSEKTNGEGLCEKKNIRVDACDHCNDDFKCFRLIKGYDTIKKLPKNGKG